MLNHRYFLLLLFTTYSAYIYIYYIIFTFYFGAGILLYIFYCIHIHFYARICTRNTRNTRMRDFHRGDWQLLILEIAQKHAPSLNKYNAVGIFVINGLIRSAIEHPLQISKRFFIQIYKRGLNIA